MIGSTKFVRRIATCVAGAVVALGVATATAGSASAAPSPGVCNGGSILPGVYTSLTINGFSTCYIDSGTVNVTGNVTLKSPSALVATFSGSDLHVKGDVIANPGSYLLLGCSPIAFTCWNSSSGSTHHSIGGKLVGNAASDMIIHGNNIKGDVKFTNGGNGNNCTYDPFLGSPDFSTFEDNNIGGAVTITNNTLCWMGFIRNQVVGTVTYNKNIDNDSDGNEIVSNKIGGDLKCQGNNPAPQAGDSGGGPNLVAGVRTGQCTSTSLP